MINVSPKGQNVGWARRTPKVKEFDEIDEIAINMARVTSQMENETESAIDKIEMLREQTKRKAEK